MASIELSNISELDLDYLEELERQALSDLRKVRRHERRTAKLRVTLSETHGAKRLLAAGYSLNLSSGGCRIFSPAPPIVADMYMLTLEPEGRPQEKIRARCLRCVLIRDEVFDTAWQFIDALQMEIPTIDGDPE